MKRFIHLIIALLMFVISQESHANELELTSCHLDNIEQRVLCGSLNVPENYSQPNGKQISLNIAVLPAIDKSKRLTPMMFLAGGPGQPATSIASLVKKTHNDVLKHRDIILVDQRGTGDSAGLECDELDNSNLYSELPLELDIEKVVDACLASIEQDLSQFSSENAVRDFDRVRQALGHETVSVYGGSYGTRAALVYMKHFPETIEAVVLDSVGPIERPIGLFGQSAARSFDIMLSDCANNPTCQQSYPDIKAQFNALISQLRASPVEIAVPHPRLIQPTALRLDDEKLISILRLSLYNTKSRTKLPYVIQQTYLGNYLPLLGVMAQSEFGMGINYALLFNIICSEDLARVSQSEFSEDANNEFGRNASHLTFVRLCEHWPKYTISDAFSAPVTANIPTLILSGDLDPVTPPSNGDYPDASLPNSKHFVVPNVGHIVAGKGCASELIADFLHHKSPQDIDGSCLNEIPALSFATGINGGL